MNEPDMVPMIEVFFSEGVEARLESLTVSTVLRSSNGMSPDLWFIWISLEPEKVRKIILPGGEKPDLYFSTASRESYNSITISFTCITTTYDMVQFLQDRNLGCFASFFKVEHLFDQTWYDFLIDLGWLGVVPQEKL